MKKILSAILVLALGVGLVACNETTKTPAETTKAEQSQESKTENKAEELKVGVFYYDYADPYISTVRDALDGMLKDAKIDFTNYDATGLQPNQTEQVNTALANGTNLLVVNIVETSSPDAAKTISEAAAAKNVPVIFFNREIADEVVKGNALSAFVGTNAPEAGHLQGKMIGEFLLKNFEKIDLNGDGEISYVMFKGQEGNAEAEARTQYGVEDADKLLTEAGKKALKYYEASANQKYLVDQNGKWSAQAGQDYMTTILSNYNEGNQNMVELVIANNDDMALGALSALEQAGYNKEGGKTIPIFGVDATDTAKGAIKAGKMTGSVKQDNVGMASTIMALVNNIKEGKELMAGTDKFNVDQGVAKIRVPYAVYTGE